MTFDSWQMALRCPPAVAVHDDRDVRRQPLEVHLAREHLVRVAGRNRCEQLLKRHGPSSNCSST
jgi:hypothetical protein